MLNNDDLRQIKDLLEPITKKLDTLDQGRKRLEQSQTELKQALTRIEQKLECEVTDLAEHIGGITTKLDPVNDHETRIRQLEDAEFPRSH